MKNKIDNKENILNKINKRKSVILEKLTLQKQLVFVMLIALLIVAFSFLILLPQVLKPFYEQNIYESLRQAVKFVDMDNVSLNENISYIICTRGGAIYTSANFKEMFGENIVARNVYNYLEGMEGKVMIDKSTYYFVKNSNNGITNVVFTDNVQIQKQESNLIKIILPTMITTTLIIMVLLYAWSNTLVTNIKKLKKKAENFGNPKYTADYKYLFNDELSSLNKAIDKAKQELKDKEEYKNYMFQNLSHQLKTPIAVIDSYVEGMTDNIVSVNDGLVVLNEQSMKLKEQLNTLLCFNKIDYMKEQSEFSKQKTDLIQLVKESVEKYKIQNKGIEYLIVTDAVVQEFRGTQDMWQMVIDNILSNFIRYAKSKIIISVKGSVLTFQNDGENISEEIIHKIFSPYVKGKNGQTGLGLAIVQRIVEAFGYNIVAYNLDKNEEKGVVFKVC